jgi:glutamyl-Q tRNA(Asp) synthetase
VGPGPYPGTCRDAGVDPRGGVAWRLRLPDAPLSFTDRLQGYHSALPSAVGDPVIRRRDGIYAYQFAVVVDDAWQGITDVVRGADLLDSTPWQLAIAAALGLRPPRYLHLPVLVESDGAKLAKSRHSVAIDTLDPVGVLGTVLRLLCPGIVTQGLEVPSLLAVGIANFDPVRLEADRKSLIFKDALG